VSDLDALQARLGHTFKDPGLLRLALTHPSAAHEPGVSLQDNQRLEFLGDSVLQLILTRELFDKFPDLGEGPLTKARAQMVNQRTLAAQASLLDLGPHLILSRGEQGTGGRQRPSILADAFEALLGAICLDAGLDVTRNFILRCFRESFGELDVIPNQENPKGELQELLQSQSPDGPEYRVESVTGPEHDRVFECSVSYRGKEIGRGTGKSKKVAECQAASSALEHLRTAKDIRAKK